MRNEAVSIDRASLIASLKFAITERRRMLIRKNDESSREECKNHSRHIYIYVIRVEFVAFALADYIRVTIP